ncbi:YCF48-related protein [Ideonella azotifigens]|uniref:YCF48-related protein n=2 Tax=Ideonella azotifigens TaxID=513160 RepID=A0ABN1KE03_9BURK|nr:YCF48-related protein [Ideonella azotifigens]MCD2344549.1 YCF48-related protein [Ideonella azotifigens]
MKRHVLAIALAACAALAQAAAPAALAEPALVTPKALGAAMLAVTRAGERLVAVGERGTVLWSDDGGTRWQQAKVPVQAALTAVRFADARAGWAVGHLGVILKTEDGGRSWARQLDGVQAAAALQAAAGADDRAQRQAQRMVEEGPDKPFFDLEVIDARHAVAVGAYGLAFATSDGGAHWAPLPTASANPKSLHLYGVRVQGERWFMAGEQGLLLHSTDGGASFAPLASPYKGSFFGLLATREGALIAYGLRGSAWRSADAGNSWDRIELGSAVTLQAGIERAPGQLVLLGQTGELFASQDDGRSFASLKTPAGPLPAAGLATAPDGAWVIASLRGIRRAAP